MELLLGAGADVMASDASGDTPLHFAAVHGHPMAAYSLAKVCPAACLARNARAQAPLDVAAACQRGEVLNAMLLACAGDTSDAALTALKKLLLKGARLLHRCWAPWAPRGLLHHISIYHGNPPASFFLLRHRVYSMYSAVQHTSRPPVCTPLAYASIF